MTANKPIDDLIIIGIDFGTTFSGIAWAYSREPDDIEVVTSWETQMSHCSDVEKAPTQLFYDKEDKATTWGYSIPPAKEALKWFKLLLLDELDIPTDLSDSTQLREARNLLKKSKKDVVEVVACYLRKIWNHAIDSIRRSVGPELLQSSRFHIVVTLPAIWPPSAEQRMKKAARISGMLDARPCGKTTLSFISEPEAAALATIKDLFKRPTIKKGDTMVICDAGGGTVDLISYVIESIDPFIVKECVKGDGGLCGGVFLDENFIKLIKTKVSPGSWEYVSKSQERKFLKVEWEHGIKRSFSDSLQQRTWQVELPDTCSGSSNRRVKRQKSLELTSNDILSVFTPIIDKIETLLRRQTQAIQAEYGQPAKYIILVGGFGRCPYLYSKLQSAMGTTILQSGKDKPWTAICRGAVVHGITRFNLSPNLGIRVDTRVARRNFGVAFTCKFDPDKHHRRHKFWSEEYQMWFAGCQVKWFLKEGECMSTKEPVLENYSMLFSEPIGQISETIYSCSTFPPPATMDPTVRELCKIHWTREPSLEALPTYTNPLGKVYHRLDYKVEMTCEDGTVDFTIYFEGKHVGARNVEVEFH
ncbi:hypothetical protein FSARC_5590 [Fusarium sarcochroum]|uniref:Uncharacterized protein n=1 Tax=Fusarium sarcochroum TaxID=1208366 RepID=A0A8H4TZI6_9HYPO|nr:hypothetical protein FSARC_5590 [Fusarium sarcochroum]